MVKAFYSIEVMFSHDFDSNDCEEINDKLNEIAGLQNDQWEFGTGCSAIGAFKKAEAARVAEVLLGKRVNGLRIVSVRGVQNG